MYLYMFTATNWLWFEFSAWLCIKILITSSLELPLQLVCRWLLVVACRRQKLNMLFIICSSYGKYVCRWRNEVFSSKYANMFICIQWYDMLTTFINWDAIVLCFKYLTVVNYTFFKSSLCVFICGSRSFVGRKLL